MPTPTCHPTETKKAEADQAEGAGFGDGIDAIVKCKVQRPAESDAFATSLRASGGVYFNDGVEPCYGLVPTKCVLGPSIHHAEPIGRSAKQREIG
jgi:hypothetical protein